MIEITPRPEKLAIVVVGYNKLGGLTRLLKSLNDAVYDNNDVPLVISIDASGDEEVYNCARDFKWKHGEKYVNIEVSRLGLKKHISQCAGLSRFFKGVIILEDDIYVSPYFYHYSDNCLDYYGNDDRVAGISLYNEEMNGYVGIPFQPVQNGYDVYAWQTVCSWGEIWNWRMWSLFTEWMKHWSEDFAAIDMPSAIKGWTRAWSKYYYAFMISTGRFFIYPYQALTTNFNDAGGEHGGGDASIVQVSLLQGRYDYRFAPLEELVKYDVYTHNIDIEKWLGKEQQLTVDFYGQRDSYNTRYVLAPFKLPYKIIKGYSLSMRPWELNVKYGMEGCDFFLYDRGTETQETPPKRVYNIVYAKYYLRSLPSKMLFKYVLSNYWSRILRKLRIK